MDNRQRDELKAWLEFYRELGIEGFYRRERGEMPVQVSESANVPAEDASRATSVSPSSPMKKTPQPQTPDPELRTEPRPVIPPQAAALNLFEAPPPPPAGPETLEHIRKDLGDCQRCKLAPTRKTIVFGNGNPHAELVFIGEGPGADEDEQGLPFVGRAGKLLNKMMQMVGIKREDVYICNIVKCRPPMNRTPEKDEVDTCSPFLYRQIAAISPRLICCLGAPAVRTVLGLKEGITKIRGQFYDFGSIKALPTVHPAYVLRNPREEKILLEDFEKIRDFLQRR